MASNGIGVKGEAYACKYLQTKGYIVLEQNYYSRYGEIDIIAQKNDIICFVEVKTRKQNSQVTGEQAVTSAKQKKIIMTALCYLEIQTSQKQPRFDVCVVIHNKGNFLICDYYKGAFDGSVY